jgi:hypothetical protein
MHIPDHLWQFMVNNYPAVYKSANESVAVSTLSFERYYISPRRSHLFCSTSPHHRLFCRRSRAMPSPVALSILATRFVSKRASKSALSGHEQQTPSSSSHFPTTLIGRQLVRTCWSTNINPRLSCQKSPTSPTVDRRFLAGSQRSYSPTYSPTYVGMVDTLIPPPPAHLATNMTAGRDNEPADTMSSLRSPQIGRGQIYSEGCCTRSWEGSHGLNRDERCNDLPTSLGT